MEGFRIARAGVARTFQNIRLFGQMSVLENLVVAQHNALMRASGYTVLGVLGFAGYRHAEEAAVERARDWLGRIGLTRARRLERRATCPTATSAGSRSRAPCAPSRCCSAWTSRPPASIRARPPSSAQLLMRIRDEYGIGVLLIEHDMSVVMGISDHIVVLDYGRKIADGAPGRDQRDANVIRAYLGEPRRRSCRPRSRPISPAERDRSDADARSRRRPRLLRPHRGAARRQHRGRARRDRHHHRRQRRRQVDAADDHLRPAASRAPATIVFEGQRLNGLEPHEIVARGIAQAPGGAAHLPAMSVLENLQMGAVPTNGAHFDEDVAARVRAVPAPRRSASTSAAARCRAASSRCCASAAR